MAYYNGHRIDLFSLPSVNVDDGWEGVRNAVRLGLAKDLYPVGYVFTTLDSETGNDVEWMVVGHDHHKAANGNLTHSMTLEMKCVYGDSSGYSSLRYDATEALYYAAEGLPAGTYNFVVANQIWYKADNGKTFQFTTTKAIPAGGQIVINATYNATLNGKRVTTYNNATSAAVIETATLTEGSEGTSLGTTDGKSDNINHMHRAFFGSNSYAQSAARQWLNSSSSAGSVWTPTNKFDRPPSWAASKAGFMKGLPADFLAAVQPAVIPCRTNSVFETSSLDGTEYAVNEVYNLHDKFFLLSRPEVYGTWDDAYYKDGELLEYYEGLTDTERIKYDAAGTARYCWLRSPNQFSASHEHFIHTTGALYDGSANSGVGVTPACIIA